MIDFIVIGGGIAGASAGARLSELGSVCILEREPALAYQASGRSAALFEENYGQPSTVALNRASRAVHETLEGGVLSPRGIMLLGSPGEADAFARDCDKMDLPDITMAEARGLVPILSEKVDRAAYDADAWDIDTEKLVQAFARIVRANGGEVRTKAEVTKIQRTAQGWDVTLKDQTLTARQIVNAGGAWADAVAQMAGVAPVGLVPHRRSMGRIPAPGGHDVGAWPMIFGPSEDWYAKPDAGALIVSPAEEDPVDPHDAFTDDMVLAEGFARYEEYVTEPVTRLLASWAGLRTFAPDRTLVLGPDPADPAFIWCAGQGGYGIQSSPAAAQLVADLVAGRTPALDAGSVAALKPDRFR